MQIKARRLIGRTIFIIGSISITLSSIFHVSNFFFWLTGVVSLIYLFSGWYYLKGYFPDGKIAFLFCLAYIYSGFFMGSAFFISDIEFLKTYLPWSIILIVVLVGAYFYRDKTIFS